MKKVAAAISVLVFLASVIFFLYSNTFKANTQDTWSNTLNSDGTWLSTANTNVARAASVQRVYGYMVDYSQQENDPIYFLTLKIKDDLTNQIVEVKVPKKMNGDVVKVTLDEIIEGIRGGDPVAVTVATDLSTQVKYLDFISIIPTE